MISASSIDRAEACPASVSLTPRAEETGDAAVIGNHVHEYLRRVVMDPNDREAALSVVPEELKFRCMSIDLEKVFAE